MGTKTDQPGVRVLPVVRYPYLIFYLLTPAMDEVRILRIRHGRRKPLRSSQI
jgi:plasmid stabilization system protein ParE